MGERTGIVIKYWLSAFWLFFASLAYAQISAVEVVGARAAGMGNTILAQRGYANVFVNPAGLVELEEFGGLLFVENRFGLPELSTIAAGAVLPRQNSAFGLSIQHYGFSELSEQKFGLSYARALFDELSIGAQFSVLTLNLNEYGSRTTISADLGLQYNLAPSVRVGAFVRNPVQIDLVENIDLQPSLGVGMQYLPAAKVVIQSDLIKYADYPVSFRLGLEYQILEILHLRGGIATEPNLSSFGLGLRIGKKLWLDLATGYHQQLGWTPSLQLSFY